MQQQETITNFVSKTNDDHSLEQPSAPESTTTNVAIANVYIEDNQQQQQFVNNNNGMQPQSYPQPMYGQPQPYPFQQQPVHVNQQPIVQQQSYPQSINQQPMMYGGQPQPYPQQPIQSYPQQVQQRVNLRQLPPKIIKPIIITTKYQDLIKQKSSNNNLYEYTLYDQDSLYKYLCCASLGFFRWCYISNDISHITIIKSDDNFNVNQSCHEIGDRNVKPSQYIRKGNDCCSCNNCCNCGDYGCCVGSSTNCCCSGSGGSSNCCTGHEFSGNSGDGVVYALIIMCILLFLSLALLLGLYMVTAPIAIFLIMYYEKITTIQFNDEKREITMISRSRYFREYFIFGTLTIPYIDIHNIYCQRITNNGDDYCLVIQLRNGNRVNISRPLKLNYDDIKSGAIYLKDFFRKRGLTFIGDINSNNEMNNEMNNMNMNNNNGFIISTSTGATPITHQMV